jgi:hypothetical protein
MSGTNFEAKQQEGRPLRVALLFIHLSLYQQVGG